MSLTGHQRAGYQMAEESHRRKGGLSETLLH